MKAAKKEANRGEKLAEALPAGKLTASTKHIQVATLSVQGHGGNVTHIHPLMCRLGPGSVKKEHSLPYRACHIEGPFTYGRFLPVSDWPLLKPLPLTSYISKEVFAPVPASSLLGVWSSSCNRLLFCRKEKSGSRVRRPVSNITGVMERWVTSC